MNQAALDKRLSLLESITLSPLILYGGILDTRTSGELIQDYEIVHGPVGDLRNVITVTYQVQKNPITNSNNPNELTHEGDI